MMPGLLLWLSEEVKAMPIKVKVMASPGTAVEVKVRRPQWQQFLSY
jgi:hypothetical protein